MIVVKQALILHKFYMENVNRTKIYERKYISTELV